METTLPSAPTGCVDGLITIPTEDGPEYAACHCPSCTVPIVQRYVPGQRGFTAEMLADMPDDEAW